MRAGVTVRLAARVTVSSAFKIQTRPVATIDGWVVVLLLFVCFCCFVVVVVVVFWGVALGGG